MILDILKVTECRPLTKVWISVVWFVLLLVGKLTLLVSKLLEDKLLQLGEFVFEYGSTNLSFLLKEEPKHYKHTKHRDIHVQIFRIRNRIAWATYILASERSPG